MPMPSFDSVGKRLSEQFDQVKQFASEKIASGRNDEKTSFPSAYLLLERSVEDVRVVFDGLMKATNEMLGSDNHHIAFKQSLKGAFERLNEKVSTLTNNSNSSDPDPLSNTNQVDLVQEITAKVCLDGANVLSQTFDQDSTTPPSADLLQRYGQIQLKLAQIRREFNAMVTKKFIEPFSTYEGVYASVLKSKKKANSARLALDTLKLKISKKGNDSSEQQEELGRLDREFVFACEDAMHEMKDFIRYTEATHCIESLIQAQHIWHVKSAEILASLS